MNNAESILVIITSVVLIIFLLLAIIATVYIIKAVRNVKYLVGKAEDVVESAEAVTEAFKNVRGPLALIKLVRNVVSMAQGKSTKSKRKK